MKQLKLEVSGMSCGHCVKSVKEALTAVPGVERADVEIGSATVEFDESLTNVGNLVDAVSDAGYEATDKSGTDKSGTDKSGTDKSGSEAT
jgi:copper chaperone CopZ